MTLLPIIAAAVAITGGQINDPQFSKREVSVPGVVVAVFPDGIDANYLWLALRTESGEILAATEKTLFPIDRLEPLIDADVTLSGKILNYEAFRTVRGHHFLNIGCTNGVRVVRPASDPFGPEARERPLTGLHRVCVQGQVTAVGKERFCLHKSPNEALIIKVQDAARMPTVGDDVLASGFCEMSYTNLDCTLTHAIYRHCARRPATDYGPPIVLARSGDFDYNHNNKLARLDGIMHHLPDGTVEIAVDGIHVRVEASAFLAVLRDRAPSGSAVRLTGVLLLDFATDPVNGFRSFDHYTVIPRSPDNLTVLRAPARKVLAIVLYPIGALVLTLVAFLVRGAVRRRQMELKVRERTRLAVELHDSVSQSLTGVALQLENAREDAGSAAGGALDTAERLLAGCRTELQACLWELRSRTFEEKTLTEACRTSLRPFVGGAGVRVRFPVPLDRLSETETNALLRIVRELVSNAIRHGGARTVRIAGALDGNTVRLSVTDDGCGFDPDTAPGPAAGHFGLAGVRERLRAHGGTLRFERPATGGTKAVATFTLDFT